MFPLGLQFINDHSIPMLAYCDLKKYDYEILNKPFPILWLNWNFSYKF